MTYKIKENAKNVWIRNNENTQDLSPLTDANSVYFNSGRTLEQELGKGVMESNIVTVNSSMSKVIDEAYDGVYESCVFKGRSLVNLLTKTIDTTWNLNLESWSIVSTTLSDCVLKPNTTYSVIVYVTEKTCPDMDDLFWVGDVDGKKDKVTHDIIRKNVSLGANVFVINTVPDFSSVTSTYRGGINFQGSKFVEGTLKWKAIILEGDWTNKELPPYFTGLCDVKMPILRNVGKNLANQSKYEIEAYVGGNDGATVAIGSAAKNTQSIIMEIEPNVSIVASSSSNSDRKVLACFNHFPTNGSKATKKTNNGYITTDTDTKYVMYYYNSDTVANGIVSQVQIEESPSPTQYEPYKTNILRTSEEIVLREVGGVCDTYNPLTGEYVQRIGELTFDGSSDEAWIKDNDTKINTYVVRISLPNSRGKSGGNGIANIISVEYVSRDVSDVYNMDIEGIGINMRNELNLSISNSKLSTIDIEGIKQYLSQKPLTVQYELAEPITTIVKPSTIPFAYKNGHIILESGYEGQSLTPILEYTAITNRTGQVENVAKTIRQHEAQLTLLEKMLITNIIELDYNNTLMALNLKMDEVK